MSGVEVIVSHLVFVHLGPRLPDHLGSAIRQAARFTKGPVHVIGEAAALARFAVDGVPQLNRVAVEDLPVLAAHQSFRDACTFDREAREGFWYFTTERFFFLAALATVLNAEDIVHLESDVMLYADLGELTPTLRDGYHGLAAPFDNDDRCIPSFVYARSAAALGALTDFIAACVRDRPHMFRTDMTLLAAARREAGAGVIDGLPIVPAFFSGPLRSRSGVTPADGALYRRAPPGLNRVFDAAAIGQYLGGVDPRNRLRRRGVGRLLDRIPALRRDTGAGFINEASLLDPSRFRYVWIRDKLGRSVPHMVEGDDGVAIANLHIHSKMLEPFAR